MNRLIKLSTICTLLFVVGCMPASPCGDEQCIDTKAVSTFSITEERPNSNYEPPTVTFELDAQSRLLKYDSWLSHNPTILSYGKSGKIYTSQENPWGFDTNMFLDYGLVFRPGGVDHATFSSQGLILEKYTQYHFAPPSQVTKFTHTNTNEGLLVAGEPQSYLFDNQLRLIKEGHSNKQYLFNDEDHTLKVSNTTYQFTDDRHQIESITMDVGTGERRVISYMYNSNNHLVTINNNFNNAYVNASFENNSEGLRTYSRDYSGEKSYKYQSTGVPLSIEIRKKLMNYFLVESFNDIDTFDPQKDEFLYRVRKTH